MKTVVGEKGTADGQNTITLEDRANKKKGRTRKEKGNLKGVFIPRQNRRMEKTPWRKEWN